MTKKPVTVLSGFLGSGKTTLLNQILKSAQGKLRVAVMINDFGDVNIDRDLVVGQAGDVLELSGGCLCCTIRGDLLASAQTLLNDGRVFDYLLVETSGVADPSSVVQTFLVPELEQKLRLDAVITVVDAALVDRWLAEQPTATEQIRCADLLILNKLDLVGQEEVEQLKGALVAINDRARVLPAVNSAVPLELLLDIGVHLAALPDESERGDRYERLGHWHHAQVDSVSLDEEMEFDYDRFDAFMQSLPDGVFRAKGTLAIQGLQRRVIFHRVGGRNVLDQGEPWGSPPRRCRAVLLGQDLDGPGLLQRLRACRADTELSIAVTS